ncbi:MAG: hypothetical protein NT129_00490 [Candidatus Aenigmarchaeota archaeon]|nr:hypothetical protein [Candidatus Aenigmarchaeota archaeon]
MYKSTESIIDELWSSNETPKKAVFTPYANYNLTARLTHIKDKFDIMLSDPEDYIGFIILENFKGGIYNITGEYRGHHKQMGFEERSGIGLEVKPKYPGMPADTYVVTPEIWFEVKVCNLRSDNDINLFEKCGFRIEKNPDGYGKVYTNAIYDKQVIPEIRIKPEQGHEISLALYDEKFAKQLLI